MKLSQLKHIRDLIEGCALNLAIRYIDEQALARKEEMALEDCIDFDKIRIKIEGPRGAGKKALQHLLQARMPHLRAVVSQRFVDNTREEKENG